MTTEPHGRATPDPSDGVSTTDAIARLRAAAHVSAGDPAPGVALVPAAGAAGASAASVPAELNKQQLANARADAVRLKAQAAEIEKQVRAEMEARLAELRDITGPLTEQIARMEEGIWTINLYLGRDEEITTLTTGTPAGANEPLVLRQEVLSMDEETAAHAEEGGIDARNLDVFDAWISEPDNLARVLPEPKGVVVLVPRRRGRDYADPWTNKALNDENRFSYFLIRNGENLYRMRTDFVVGKRLIPATDEFTSLFTTTRYNPTTRTHDVIELVPGTREWANAEEAQDARQRHYMRVALILQGLVDRTAVFAPLPDAGINLLDARTYADGRAHLIRDAEAVLTDGRDDFFTWLTKLHANLRPGMRILGAFNTEEFRDAGSEYTESGRYFPNDRITPRARSSYDADKPATGELYTLEGRRNVHGEPGFYFKFARTTPRWIGSGYDAELRAPKTKGTCVVLPGDRFLLPFDLVTVEDMRYYLNSRRNRAAYEYMFPLLKAAIAAKAKEAAAEAPFRTLLAGELVKAHDLDLAVAEAAVGDLVNWWKLANKWHRPLVTADDLATEAKAIAAIVAEYGARTRTESKQNRDGDREAAVVAALLEHDPSILVIGRKRDGSYLAFAPQPRRHGAGTCHQKLWVREYTTTATAKTIKSRDWVTPGLRMDKTRLVHATPAWDGWDTLRGPNEDLTDAEIDTFVAALAEQVPAEYAAGWRHYRWSDHKNPFRTDEPAALDLLGVTHDPDNRTFEVWLTPATEPAALEHAPSAVAGPVPTIEHCRVRVTWEKTRRGGARLADRPAWDAHALSRHYGDDDTSPWGKVWDGASRDPKPVLLNEQARARVAGLGARIREHNEAVAALRAPAEAALARAHEAAAARIEAAAYARFLDDYADPDLWDGHRKTLHLRPSWYPNGHHVDGVVYEALYRLTDAGVLLDMTIWEALAAAGLSDDPRVANLGEEFLTLPLA